MTGEWAALGTVEPVLETVRAELDAVFGVPPLAGRAPAAFTDLWARLHAQTEGGKLLRPRLVALGARSVPSGADPVPLRAVARLGAAFELLHAALIVHDDVIDRDVLRRGRPTLAEQYRVLAAQRRSAAGAAADEASHVGASVAVIGGDVLLTEAFGLGVLTSTVVDSVDGSLAADAEMGSV